MRGLTVSLFVLLTWGNSFGANEPVAETNISAMVHVLATNGYVVAFEHNPRLKTVFSGSFITPEAAITEIRKAGYTVAKTKSLLRIYSKNEQSSLSQKLKKPVKADKQRLDSVVDLINAQGITTLNLAFAPSDVSLKIISVDLNNITVRDALSAIADKAGYKSWSTTPLTGENVQKNVYLLNFQ